MLRRENLESWLHDLTKGTVQSGPFRGMKVPREQSWESGCLCPTLLGTHEEELHNDIEAEIGRLVHLPHPKIVNIGCAEGYYAIGFAMRLRKATVWAVDINDTALVIARHAAEMNDVTIVTGSTVDDMFEEPDLVVMDCEGDEIIYLDPVRYPGLLKAAIIVEVHNKKDPPIRTDDILLSRWNRTHHVTAIVEGGRDPNKFEFLRGEPSIVRWMTVCENRPCLMGWYVMRPR